MSEGIEYLVEDVLKRNKEIEKNEHLPKAQMMDLKNPPSKEQFKEMKELQELAIKNLSRKERIVGELGAWTGLKDWLTETIDERKAELNKLNKEGDSIRYSQYKLTAQINGEEE